MASSIAVRACSSDAIDRWRGEKLKWFLITCRAFSSLSKEQIHVLRKALFSDLCLTSVRPGNTPPHLWTLLQIFARVFVRGDALSLGADVALSHSGVAASLACCNVWTQSPNLQSSSSWVITKSSELLDWIFLPQLINVAQLSCVWGG